ncbi:MAG: transporter substrate-binding domain-containing protein [Pseudomonadota bacterium]
MLILLIPLQVLHAADAQEIPTRLTACGDADGYPPFSYFERRDGQETNTVAGYDIDFLRELLTPLGHTIEFSLLPWLRCLNLVSTGEIDIALDVSRFPERDRQLRFPRSHYATTAILIQLRQPELIAITTPAELERQRICIINGWAFASLGMSENARPVGTPPTPAAAANMLRTGRCSILPYSLEAMIGNALLDPDFILSTDEFTYAPIPWALGGEKHFGVSRQLPYGESLVELLDQGITRMLETGDAERIRQDYLLP